MVIVLACVTEFEVPEVFMFDVALLCVYVDCAVDVAVFVGEVTAAFCMLAP